MKTKKFSIYEIGLKRYTKHFLTIFTLLLLLNIFVLSCNSAKSSCVGCETYYTDEVLITDRGQVSYIGLLEEEIDSDYLSTFYLVQHNPENYLLKYSYTENTEIVSKNEVNFKNERVSLIKQDLQNLEKEITYEFSYEQGRVDTILKTDDHYITKYDFVYNNAGDRMVFISDKPANINFFIFNKINYNPQEDKNIISLYNTNKVNIRNKIYFYTNSNEETLTLIEEYFETIGKESGFNQNYLFNLEKGYLYLSGFKDLIKAFSSFDKAFQLYDFEHTDYDGKILYENFIAIKKQYQNILNTPEVIFEEEQKVKYEKILLEIEKRIKYLEHNLLENK